MLYELSDDTDMRRFRTRCAALERTGARVELSERRPRTLSQNKYLHLLLGWFALEYGDTLEFVKEAYFKRLCNADLFCVRRLDRFLGEVERLRSTRDVTTAELTTAIERFRAWSSKECGIYLPAPDEADFLRVIEKETARQAIYM